MPRGPLPGSRGRRRAGPDRAGARRSAAAPAETAAGQARRAGRARAGSRDPRDRHRCGTARARRRDPPGSGEATGNRERGAEELRAATRIVNRALSALRAEARDPLVQEVGATQALAIRFGHGSGDELAEGRWTEARELPRHRAVGRLDDVAPQSRVAAVLAGRDEVHPAETLMLRARLDAHARKGRRGPPRTPRRERGARARTRGLAATSSSRSSPRSRRSWATPLPSRRARPSSSNSASSTGSASASAGVATRLSCPQVRALRGRRRARRPRHRPCAPPRPCRMASVPS